MAELASLDREYKEWIRSVSQKYRQSQIKAAVSVNRDLLAFYWDLGRDISEREKKWGWRFLWGIWSGEVVNSLIKLTACAYRPWIRSDKIEPAGDSKVAATGYSFPSRHTVYGTQLYGNTIAWQKNKRRWLAILCGVLLALTGFSRNFLGAPELPVLAAVGIGIILAWEKLFEPATIVLLLGTHWGNLLARFISIIFGVVIWPMVIRREVRRGAELRARERAGGAAHGI